MANDKRKRLIQAAKKLFTEKGYQATTLAMIATESDVPLGNVYYYFKSKEAFMDAVINTMDFDLQQQINTYAQQPNPGTRLSSYLDDSVQNSVSLTQYGDSLLNISKQASSVNNDLKEKSISIANTLFQWVQKQFEEMGHERSERQATNFLQKFYGILDLSMIRGEASYLVENIDGLKKEFNISL